MNSKRLIVLGLLLTLAVGCNRGARNDASNSRPGDVEVEELGRREPSELRTRLGNLIVKKKIWRILMRGPEDEDKNSVIVRICQRVGGCADKNYR